MQDPLNHYLDDGHHGRALRPWPVLRFGLFLYDHLGGARSLPATTTVDLGRDTDRPLKDSYRRALECSSVFVASPSWFPRSTTKASEFRRT